MNICAKKGDKIVCSTLSAGLLSPDQKTAKKHLKKGGIYTVEKTVPHGFHTKVYLQEFPGVEFNSVFFEDCS